jgi:hypothetical protein
MRRGCGPINHAGLMAPPTKFTAASHLPRCFLRGRHPSILREVIDQGRQMPAEPCEQIVALHAGLFAKHVECVDPDYGL